LDRVCSRQIWSTLDQKIHFQMTKKTTRQGNIPADSRQVLVRLALVGMLVGASVSNLAVQQAEGGGEKPNILLITADDLGTEVGCYGDPIAQTPNIDNLATNGVLFENAFVTQASCSSSRSSILTGLYPHQNNQIGLAHRGFKMYSSISTLPQMLKRVGYRTGVIGKVHVAPAKNFPFDFDHSHFVVESRDVRGVATQARQFIQEDQESPFFLMVNYIDPHRPFSANEDQYMGLPEIPIKAADVKPFPFLGVDSTALRAEVATFYNCVARLDTGVGLLLDEIDKAGIADETIVIFLGDHGPPFTRAKTSCYEAGLKIPLIIKWPGVFLKRVTQDKLTSTIDIVPTLLELVNIEQPTPLPGISLKPILLGQDVPWREAIFSESTFHTDEGFAPRRSIRNKRFKLIHNLVSDKQRTITAIGAARGELAKRGSVVSNGYQTYMKPPEYELYDLKNDPQEWNNLANQEDFQDIQTDLLRRLNLWRRDTQDPLLERGNSEISHLLPQ